MIKIAICDDEKYFRDEIERYCRQYLDSNNQVYAVVLFKSGEEFRNSNMQPDILFLDIEMGRMSGLDVAKNILQGGNKKTFIVYITSHYECALDAFDINVLGFLKKPITYEDIKNIFEKAEMRTERFRIVCTHDGRKILAYQILYLEAQREYTNVWLLDGSCILERKNMKEWESELQKLNFFRIHKSYIVNMYLVKKYVKESRQVYVGDVVLDVAKRRGELFREAYELYMEQCIWG